MLPSTPDDLCPVCGWALREAAWSGGAPSWDTCPACGTTFGLDDGAEAGVPDTNAARAEAWEARREAWVAAGMPWSSPGHPSPVGWRPGPLLRRLGGVSPWDRRALVDTAEGILGGEVPVPGGVRSLVTRLSEVAPALLESGPGQGLREVDSALGGYPQGEARSLWDPAYLARLDAELEAYLERVRPSVEAHCRGLVARLAKG